MCLFEIVMAVIIWYESAKIVTFFTCELENGG